MVGITWRGSVVGMMSRGSVVGMTWRGMVWVFLDGNGTTATDESINSAPYLKLGRFLQDSAVAISVHPPEELLFSTRTLTKQSPTPHIRSDQSRQPQSR